MLETGALEVLQETAVKAAEPRIMAIPGNPRKAILVRGDHHEIIDVGNGVRSHKVEYPLVLSKPFRTLEKLDAGDCCAQQLEHRQLMRLLRVEFARCLQREDLVPLLLKIDFSMGDNAGSLSDRGRESLGRSVHAEIQQADQIPETFFVDVPVYENRDVSCRITIECALELFPAEKKFRVTPLPGQVSAAMEAIQTAIHAMLDARLQQFDLIETVPVFFGAP